MEKELETMENTTHTISSFCHKNELSSSDPAENDNNSLPFAEIRDRIDVVVVFLFLSRIQFSYTNALWSERVQLLQSSSVTAAKRRQ